MTIELALFILGLLLLVSILASKISDRVGVPALLIFLVVGMLAGSDGPGGIYFDNAFVAQFISVFALTIILFSGGLDTDWASIRPVLGPGAILALLGVLLTALVVGAAAVWLLDFSLLEGMLLGAIISSTDAAAVFSILRGKGVHLKGQLRPLLELESGINDPMAVFLTLSLVQLLLNPELSAWQLIPRFLIQMGLGALFGVAAGWLGRRLINSIRLSYDGLYLVLVFTLAVLTYGLTGWLGGSGFLAVYLAGVILGNSEFIHRRSILRFFDGLAWLMQITIFLTLGLLVFPSRLPQVILPGLLIAAVLMFVARPAGVFVSLIPFPLRLPEKLFVAWVGLRGAAPVILATFPLLAGISQAETLFHLVFFVVLASVLFQGPSLPWVARGLGVEGPAMPERQYPIEPSPSGLFQRRLREIDIPPGSPFAGRQIVDLGLPPDFLVILIHRGGEYLIASGATQVQAGDQMLVISDEAAYQSVQKSIMGPAAIV